MRSQYRIGFVVGIVPLVLSLLVTSGCRMPRTAGALPPAVPDRTATVNAKERPVATDWSLALQAYTYRKFTFLDAVDACVALGIPSLEAYPGQELGGGLTGTLDHNMDEATCAALLEILRLRRVSLVAYGVVNGRDERDWRQIFTFAKRMGIGTVCTEPDDDVLDLVCALADELGITVALHNHAEPAKYWNPAAVLKACEGRTSRIGACIDNGHWARSGLQGAAAARRLEDRIRWVHLKDVNAPAEYGHCVPFGTGAADVTNFLAELRLQGYKGCFSIEYESDTGDPGPAVEACVGFFMEARRQSADELSRDTILPAGMVRDVAGTWRHVTPGAEGHWKEFEPPDLSGYLDVTDGAGGRISASGDGFPKELYSNAFDNTKAKWCIKTRTIWIQYAFPEGRRPGIIAYTIMSANDCPARDPKDWRLLGSDDGATWSLVDEQKGQSFPGRFAVRLYPLKSPATFRMFKLDVTANHGAEESQLSEIELLVARPPDPELSPGDIDALFAVAADPAGYVPLFDGTFAGAILKEGSWKWEGDGVLEAKGGSDIWTKKAYGDAVVDLEFQCAGDTNSGVFLRCDNIGEWLHRAIEIQILQPDIENKKHICGAIFDCMAPVKYAVRPVGEWNHMTIIAKANRILVQLNGERILDADLNDWVTAGLNPDGSPNKFRYAYRSMPRRGAIGLQYHGQPIRFRNVRVKELQ